jgi:hypothetical protein
MVVSYFILNFLPLMILLALITMMFVNRDVKIPRCDSVGYLLSNRL